MGNFVSEPSSMFRSVHYNVKTTEAVKRAMEKKVAQLNEHAKVRVERIKKLQDEYKITDSKLSDLVIQYTNNQRSVSNVSYNNSSTDENGIQVEVTVPAGVIANIVSEKQMITSERGQVAKMEIVLRNITNNVHYIRPDTGEVSTRTNLHTLTDDELEYLGF